jgi:hypothetical protein
MSSEAAQLSAILSAVDELAGRVAEVADNLADGPRDDVSADLYEVERSLRTAVRRLDRTVQSLR